MNRDALNQYLQAFFADEESITSDTPILWQKKLLNIDEKIYRNPLSMTGDNEDNDVAASENLAYLVDYFMESGSLEERYSFVIHNITFDKCQVNNLMAVSVSLNGINDEEKESHSYHKLVDFARKKICEGLNNGLQTGDNK